MEDQILESKENLKLVIVGHVDHGKSTLIGRLFYDTNSLPEGKFEEIKKTCEALGKEMEFGYIMDHLQEERDQGITIDTAQTFFKTKKRDYVIIDAPGHREFLKNMITGASQAEAAILVVDAKESVQEQTRRHAYILSMLGLDQVMVCMNKMDLIDNSKEIFEKNKKELIIFLKKINITPSFIIPISAKDGDNIANKSEKIDWYDGPTILEALDNFQIKEADTEKPFRFPIQDIYKFDEKRIYAGRIESGKVKEKQKIIAFPSKEEAKIETIEVYKKDVNKSSAGMSIGLTLDEPLFLDRGFVISEKENLPQVSKKIKAHLFWMDKNEYNLGDRLVIKCATQEIPAEIKEIERIIDSSNLEEIESKKKKIENRQVADVIIETSEPLVFDNFNDIPELGRFVLERDSNTCAGGIITNIS